MKRHTMGFCSSSFGNTHHSATSSRVLICGSWCFIVHLIGALVRGNSLSQRCFVVCPFSSESQNTPFRSLFCNISPAASSRFHCRYTCWRSFIALSGSSELRFTRLPSWWIWSKKRFRRCIINNLKSGSLTRCWALSDCISISSSSKWRLFETVGK